MDDTDNKNRAKTVLGQLLRFNLVGAFNTGVTYLFYAGLVTLGVHHMAALGAEYIVGIVISFTLNRRITFRAGGSGTLRRFTRMVWTYLVLLAINMGILWGLVDRMGRNKLISQLAALVVVTGLSFLVQKLYVFRRLPDHGHPD